MYLKIKVILLFSSVKALTDWLQDCGKLATQRSRNQNDVGGMRGYSRQLGSIELPSPAPAHVHCVAAILWYSHDLPVTYNIHGIVSKELLR